MAINLETQYPGKVAPSTPDYPYGAARNITTPGDGTGTPWEAALVNDLVGWQQALLDAAAIVPSSTPDKVGASQYLQSLKALFPSRGTVAGLAAAKDVRIGQRYVLTDRADGTFEVITAGVTPGVDQPDGFEIIDVGGGLAARIADQEPSVKSVAPGTYDGMTDNTASIIAWLQSLPADTRRMYRLDRNVAVDLKLVIPEIPVGVVLRNEYARTGNNSPSYLEKQVGFITSDAVDNDTVFWIDSGHNTSRGLNNFRTSGTDSADRGAATDVWALGMVEGNQGRNMALTQWTKITGSERWMHALRKLSPWEAASDVNDPWEFWKEGETITTGQYRKGTNMYVAASSGVTGAAKPTHSSGTASDGGVDWTYVGSGDATIHSIDELGRMSLNGVSSDSVWQLNRMSQDDTDSTTMNLEWQAAGPSMRITCRYKPTDAGGSQVATPFWLYDGDTGETSLSKTVTGDIWNATDDLFTFRVPVWSRSEVRKESVTAADGDATPSVSGVNSLLLTNSGATSITALDDGTPDQEVQLIATNGNTTLVNSSGLRLEGGINLVMTPFTIVTVRRIDNAVTSAWIEVSRSVK